MKKLLKKIPGVVFAYRSAKACLKLPKRIARKCLNTYKNVARECEKRLKAYLRKKSRQNLQKSLDKWTCDSPFSDLIMLAKSDFYYLKEASTHLIQSCKYNPKGYAIMHACFNAKPKEARHDVAAQALAVGNELVNQGKLKEASDFFVSLQKLFPEVFEPYTLLYSMLQVRQEEYRKAPKKLKQRGKKPLLFSFMIWGENYIRFFNEYCIPSMLAEGNIPAMSTIRNVCFDLYVHEEDIAKLKQHTMFQKLSALCDVNFVTFPKRLIACEGYKKDNAAFRYNIYGGFHHLSIERARALGADVMCLGPDNIYANGSLMNYVKLVDSGYNAVLFISTRAQAEAILPTLDAMKNPATGTLSITPEEMVDLSAQHIHHTFLEYVVTDKTTPVWRSGFYIPHRNGFHIRSFHYHPVIISAEAIDRSKNIQWNYTTVDANMITALFPNKEDWKTLKVITDSNEGIMLDLAYGNPSIRPQPTEMFSEAYLDKINGHFNENHFWNFGFTVEYKIEKPMEGVRTYFYDEAGTLASKLCPLTPEIEEIHNRIENWYNNIVQPVNQQRASA